MRTIALAAILAAVLLAPAAAEAATTTVKVHPSRYGRILVDGQGRTLYLFTRDRGPKSRCYGACARAWPPLIADSDARAGGGAHAPKLGTTAPPGGAPPGPHPGPPPHHPPDEPPPGPDPPPRRPR